MVLVVSACGGLDNRPLATGAVSGTALGCDSEGVVGIVGDASVRVTLGAPCTFKLEGLRPGTHQLYVAATAKRVALVPASVEATKLANVGEIEGRPGAFARVRVSAPGSVELEGELAAPDLPITSTIVGRSGMARIGPFPEGCFRLEVSMRGLGKRSATSCLAEGGEENVDVVY